MKNDKQDFTERNYERLLKLIKNKTVFYDELEKYNVFTLWRHDVDFSVHRAYSLAKIESKNNIKATYFFQLGSVFYNIFEQEIKDLVLNILSLGHQIGLHFDPTQYEIQSKEDLENYLSFEKKILENLFQIHVKVFSFHNPTEDILKYDDFEYVNMINTYAEFFKKISYCSDSNGYWRHENLEIFLKKENHKQQILTHPNWWQKKVLSPNDRVNRSIKGRQKKAFSFYFNLLKECGRKNVK